jgi:hypothetical protein
MSDLSLSALLGSFSSALTHLNGKPPVEEIYTVDLIFTSSVGTDFLSGFSRP